MDNWILGYTFGITGAGLVLIVDGSLDVMVSVVRCFLCNATSSSLLANTCSQFDDHDCLPVVINYTQRNSSSLNCSTRATRSIHYTHE
jgi:hypothetical protein